MLALFGPIGTPELIIILVVALLLFGRRLPEVARSLGKGVVEFKKGLKGVEEDLDRDPTTPQQQQPTLPRATSPSSLPPAPPAPGAPSSSTVPPQQTTYHNTSEAS